VYARLEDASCLPELGYSNPMPYFVDPAEISVVVHTHPPRLPYLGTLTESIAQSDIMVFDQDYEVACEPPGMRRYEKLLFWLMALLRHARRGKYVLCLDDDVIVNRHILHNLASWPALEDPNFGMGVAFCGGMVLEPPLIQTPYGWRRERALTPQSQAHFYRSEILTEATMRIWDVLHKEGYRGIKIEKIVYRFDGNITAAFGALRRRIYVHRPSLVDCSEVSMIESLAERRPRGKGAREVADFKIRNVQGRPHRALDFDLEWRRGKNGEGGT